MPSSATHPNGRINVKARRPDGSVWFSGTLRIDTPQEAHYYEHGGILHFVLRQLLNRIEGRPFVANPTESSSHDHARSNERQAAPNQRGRLLRPS